MAQRRIDIHLDGAFATVDAAHVDIVAPLLTFTTYPTTAWNGILSTRAATKTFGRIVDDAFRFPSKLALKVEVSLSQAGHSVTLPSARFAQCRFDSRVLAAAPEPAKSVFANPGNQRGGLFLDSAKAFPPATMIPWMLRALAGCRCIVAVGNRELVTWWMRHLQSSNLPQRVCDVRDLKHCWDRNPKVHVCSFSNLDAAQRFDFDIVIVPDAECLLDNDRWDEEDREKFRWDFRLLRDTSCPSYGFVNKCELSRGEMLRANAMFLRTILTRPKRSPVCVRVVTFNASTRFSMSADSEIDLAIRKRVCIWTPLVRNEFVANLAETEGAIEHEARVVVLVENLCHARELSQFLPGWSTLSRKGDVELADAGRKLIVTETAMAESRIPAFDVIVDARGCGAIPSKILPDDPERATRLIDVADCHPRWLAANGQGRRDEYATRKWEFAEA